MVVSPPEKKPEEHVQPVDEPNLDQQEVTPCLNEVPTDNGPPCYYSEDDDDEDEDDGSDYYFSLPSIVTPVGAVDLFAAMGVSREDEDVTTDFDAQVTIATEAVEMEDAMYVEALNATKDEVAGQELTNVNEVVIAVEDAVTEDAEASTLIDDDFPSIAEETFAIEIIEDTMHDVEPLNAIQNVETGQERINVEAVITTGDAMTEDAKASMSIDEVTTPNHSTPDAALLGSIWVPDPKHGLVRRSARLRVRG